MLTRTLALVTALSLGLATSGYAFASTDTNCGDSGGQCTSDSIDTASKDSVSKDPVSKDNGKADSRNASVDTRNDRGSNDGSKDAGKGHK